MIDLFGVAWTRVVAALVGGVVLGLFYYGGLWWTVRRLTVARHPASLVLISFGLRMLVTLAALFWITGGAWALLGVSLVAFLAMRTLLVRRLGPNALDGRVLSGNIHGTQS